MQNSILPIIDEMIKVEQNVSQLYQFFASIFPDDRTFWWDMMQEEINHSTLIMAIKDNYLLTGKVPEELLPDAIEPIKETNTMIQDIIQQYKKYAPDRASAFNISIKLENSAAELHFQNAMIQKDSSPLMKIYRELNKLDKDHAERIASYAKANLDQTPA